MSIKATAIWTSATVGSTTLMQSVEDTTSVLVSLIISGTITAGQINFEASDDGANWYSIPGLVQATFSIFTNWQPSFGSPVALQFNIAGYTQFRLNLATVLTGSGSVTVNITNEVSPFLVVVSAVQQFGPNQHMVLDDSTGTHTATVSAAGALKVDGSATTQPVSLTSTTITGTVAVTESGTWTVRAVGNAGAILDGVITAATAPANGLAILGVFNSALPTLTTGQSAAIQVNSKGMQLVQLGDGTTNVAVIAATTALKTDLSSVAGTATITAAAGVQKVGIVGNAGATLDAAVGTLPTNNGADIAVPTTGAGAAISATSLSVTTSVNVKASAGNIYGLYALNGAASTAWVQFVNAAGTGTLGTGALFSVPIPASTTQPVWVPLPYPVNATTGIAVGASTTNNGATAVGTAVAITVFFK